MRQKENQQETTMPYTTCSICLAPAADSAIQDPLCESCLESLHTRCSHCDYIYKTDDMICSTEPICRGCFARSYNHCHDCGSVRMRGELSTNVENCYCHQCITNYSQVCDICDKPSDSIISHYLGVFCQACSDTNIISCKQCGNTCLKYNMAYDTSLGGMICMHCELDKYEWTAQAFTPGGSTYDDVVSELSFGIEIETSRCLGFSSLCGNTIWACTNDYSIGGKEFVSPPLHGDAGLTEIRDFCSYAVDHEWESDDRCGLHLHIGLEDFGPQELKSLAYAYHITYPLWSKFVPENRCGDSMCGSPGYNKSEIEKITTGDYEDWEYFVAERDRFDAVNWRAFLVHGTVELRLLHGTLDSDLICNWIKAHTRFIDFVTKQNVSDLYLFFHGDIHYQFTALTAIIGPELANYYSDLAFGFSTDVRPTETSLAPF